MAYASVTYTSASGTTFALTNSNGDPIPYIRQSDIKVYVNTVLQTVTTDYTFNSAGTAIVLNTSVSGATVLLQRITDIADPTVVYTAGSTLTAQDLNNADNQIRFGLQEFQDSVDAGGGVPDGNKGDINVGGNGTIWTVDNSAITEVKIASGAVTETKIGTGAVTSTKIADNTIVNADINSAAAITYSKLNLVSSVVDADISTNAEIAVSKLADGTARQLLQTNAAGTGVEWTSNVDVPGTLDVAGNTTLDGNLFVGGSFDVTSINGGPIAGSRNRLINGDMRIWQRGTTLNGMTPTLGVTYYTADRWFVSQLISQSSTDVSQQTGGATRFSARVQKRVGSTGASANQLGQVVENLNCLDLPGKQITLSFTTKAGADYSAASNALNVFIYTCTTADQSSSSFVNGTAAGQATLYSGTVTLTTSNQTFSITTSAVAANATNICLVFTENSSASAAGANDWFEISDVQIEPGTVATPFERRSYGQELALCQRYCLVGSFYVTSASSQSITYTWPSTMRTAPTIAGGGTGFASTISNVMALMSQTTGALQTLTASAEL